MQKYAHCRNINKDVWYLLECMQKRLVLKKSIKDLVDDGILSVSEMACKHHPFDKSLAWKCQQGHKFPVNVNKAADRIFLSF